MLYMDGIGISFLLKEVKEKILNYKLTKNLTKYIKFFFSFFFF